MLIDFWFGLIVVLWAGYLILEGFDFGVGMLLPFAAHTPAERSAVLSTIGPVWDGNEVWLIVAGGATFAAFPGWYASLFSGYYLPLALILVGLILRGASIELRSKAETSSGQTWCDRGVIVGSALPALLWGVAFANFVRGVPIDNQAVVHASLWSLLSPYGLLGGVTSLLLFAAHGAHFLSLRTTDTLHARAGTLARRLTPAAAIAAVGFVIATTVIRGDVLVDLVGAGTVVAMLTAVTGGATGRSWLAFAGTTVTCALLPVMVFSAAWPYAIVGLHSHGLTLATAASGPTTLRVMTGVAVLFTPVVLAYQAWSYWVFRQRITAPAVTPDMSGGTSTTRAPRPPGGSPGSADSTPSTPILTL